MPLLSVVKLAEPAWLPVPNGSVAEVRPLSNTLPDVNPDDGQLGRLPDIMTLARALGVGVVACMLNPHHVRVWELPFELAGSHTVVATYSGDANYQGSTATVIWVVNPAPTLLAVRVDPNPSPFGQPATITAFLGSALPGTLPPATGTVTFSVDGVTVG